MQHLLNFKPDAYSCEYAIGHKFYTIKKNNKTAFVSQYPEESYANLWIDEDMVKIPLIEGTIEFCANKINEFINL